MRRLRDASHASSGRPRVTVRANYVGLPSMAGRGAEHGGESRPGLRAQARNPRPEVRSRRPKIAAVERRPARHPQAGMSTPERMGLCRTHGHHAWREFVNAPVGAPLPRVCPEERKTGAPEPDPNTGRSCMAVFLLPLPLGERVGVRGFLPQESPYALTRSLRSPPSPHGRGKKPRCCWP